MLKFDPIGEQYDVVTYDGASDEQYGGEAIATKVPNCSVVYGSNHVVFLLLEDIFIRILCKWWKNAFV